MILIYVPETTNRVLYIFDFIFSEVLKTDYKFTTDKAEYLQYKGPCLSYAHTQMEGLHFGASDLLFENEIRSQNIRFFSHNSSKVFFEVKNGALPFDPFAAAFFLVSRYEEYLPHIKDRHNRFKPETSTAFRGEFLDRPIVNVWAAEIREIIQKQFPEVYFPSASTDIKPSIMVNTAYAYKHRGFWSSFSDLSLLLLKFKFKRFVRRFKVITGYSEDPYDTYERIEKLNNHYNVTPDYYILFAEKSKFNRSLSANNPYLIRLIKRIHKKYPIGLYASYYSSRSVKKIASEKSRLEHTLNEPVKKNRQHYYKINFPKTYSDLIELGIEEDHSMGYAGKMGFRASTCTPFKFYDLTKDKTTSLKVFSFVMSDTACRKYLRMKPREVIPFMKPVFTEVKQLGGQIEFIYTNESVGNQRDWKSWGDSYEDMLKLISTI